LHVIIGGLDNSGLGHARTLTEPSARGEAGFLNPRGDGGGTVNFPSRFVNPHAVAGPDGKNTDAAMKTPADPA